MRKRVIGVTAAAAVLGIVAFAAVRKALGAPAPQKSTLVVGPGPFTPMTSEELAVIQRRQRKLRESLWGQIALRLARRNATVRQ